MLQLQRVSPACFSALLASCHSHTCHQHCTYTSFLLTLRASHQAYPISIPFFVLFPLRMSSHPLSPYLCLPLFNGQSQSHCSVMLFQITVTLSTHSTSHHSTPKAPGIAPGMKNPHKCLPKLMGMSINKNNIHNI